MWRGTAGSYSRPRGAAVSLAAVERQLLPRREQANVWLAAARDEELLAGGRALHVPAKTAAALVDANGARGVVSGASRDRTGDLLLAKQALSQLSYGPRRQMVGGPVYRRPRPFLGGSSRNWIAPIPATKSIGSQ